MDAAVNSLEEASRTDLEQCEAAIKAGDHAVTLEAIERAFAKIDSAIDVLRTAQPQLS